jgi:hypothetical protein
MVDAIPSPALSMLAKPTPASTLTWMVAFLGGSEANTDSGWWRIDAETSEAEGGYTTLTSLLRGPDGRPVARSHQVVMVYG